jgi:hypothetical protein
LEERLESQNTTREKGKPPPSDILKI